MTIATATIGTESTTPDAVDCLHEKPCQIIDDVIADQFSRALSLLQIAQDASCRVHATLACLTAFACLEQALCVMQQRGLLSSRHSTLRKRMSASYANGVPWLDYPRLQKALLRRNAAAHGRLLLELSEVRDYIGCIAAQLEVWRN